MILWKKVHIQSLKNISNGEYFWVIGKKLRSTAYFKVIIKIIFKDIYNLFFSCLGLICSNVSLKGRGCCFGWLKKVVFFLSGQAAKKNWQGQCKMVTGSRQWVNKTKWLWNKSNMKKLYETYNACITLT